MAKVTSNSRFQNLDPDTFQNQAAIFLEQLALQFNGKIGITSNLDAKIISVTFTGANQTVAVSHSLGRKPVGYIKHGSTTNITVFDGVGTNTATVIYLQASGAGTAQIMLY